MPARISNRSAWLLGTALAVLMVGVPYVYYRASYGYQKRLRPIVEGRVYRAGSMTAPGFRDAIRRHGIKTVLNFQEEAPDPDLPGGYFDRRTVKESQVVTDAGATYVPLTIDLVPSNQAGKVEPEAMATLRAIFDDPTKYPILIHCRAGLHRTGVVAAMYRMEYQGWTAAQAYRELKAHGFGEFTANAANDQVLQYCLRYRPRATQTAPRPVAARLTSRPAE